MDVSVYTLIAVTAAAKELFNPDGAITTMTYFGGEKCVPGYNVMGICKAALEATVRYLAYDMGPQDVRVNHGEFPRAHGGVSLLEKNARPARNRRPCP